MISQERIIQLALAYKDAEWKWLHSLPPQYKAILAGGKLEEFDPTLFTYYGEFFLTLCGIKPCLLLSNLDHPTFALDLINNVLSPFFPFLDGFEIFSIFDKTSSSQIPKQMFIFTSPHHPKFHLIRELFLKPHNYPVPSELLSKALGYPVPTGSSTFCYVDKTTTQEVGVDCIVFEFTANAGFERSIKMHFERCAAEFKKLGKELAIVCQ